RDAGSRERRERNHTGSRASGRNGKTRPAAALTARERHMATPDRESRLREAQDALKRLGVDLENAPVDVLERVLADDPRAAFAVAERLGSVASEESARVLARLEAGGDKLLRREARRSLYRLRQKGIEAAATAPAAETTLARPLLGGPEP